MSELTMRERAAIRVLFFIAKLIKPVKYVSEIDALEKAIFSEIDKKEQLNDPS